MKKKNIYIITLLTLVLCISTISCSKDDPKPEPEVIDPDPDPDPDPTGFLGEIDFVKTFGGSNIDEANDVVAAPGGGYVIFGSTKSTDGDLQGIGTPGNNNDFWALKIDAQGEQVWSKTYGGPNDEEGFSISNASDGGYILSGYSRSSTGEECGGTGDVCGNEGFQDYWIVKINGSGDLQWEKNYGFLGGEKAYSVIQTSDGGYFATGVLDVTGSGGQGNDDGLTGSTTTSRNSLHGLGEFWGIKMDANGNKQWRRYFGGMSNEESRDVLQTPDGGYLMVGFSESEDVDITDSKGTYDFWVVKSSAAGDIQWTKSYGGTEIDNAFSITAAANGTYIIVGDTRSPDVDVTNPRGNADLWAVKFDGSNGNLIWQKTYGGTQFESAQSIHPVGNGNYVIAGSSRSTDGDATANYGQNDMWVMTIDENGALQFQISIGGEDLDLGNEAIATPDGKLLVVGETDSNSVGNAQNKGIKDVLVAKIK